MSAAPSGQRSAVTAARGLAGLLLGAGAGHFVFPQPFDAIVPPELPGSARMYTYVSGVAELVIGALLLFPRTRRRAGLAAAALFVAVFPANIYSVRLFWAKPWMRAGTIARLPLQIPMIVAALRVWRAG
ncbi:DoxX family protein [Mycobacterium sp. P7213]|uniref:DoxX family protein n=1 Tax=Mycobacterium sp. P7213 TaxID=2478465 RepID=UPI000F62E2FB|nr:MauE/DoxX family redox-associated membrane protein [Mycobacterium sp. P7213]